MNASAPFDASIPVAQNREELLRYVRAWTHRYGVAQRFRRARLVGTVGLSLAGPVVVLAAPASGAWLGALAGAWTVLARTALGEFEQLNRRRGAGLQEAFDTRLFGLPWNAALAGRQPAPEDVADDADRVEQDGLRDWYPAAAAQLIRPLDVLLCQRSSVVWGRRTHTAYAALLLALTAAWWLVCVVIAVFAELTLAAYLVGLFLPSMPALLDAGELWRAHRAQAHKKGSLEHDIDEVFAAARAAVRPPELTCCREIQDRIYLTRRVGPQAPRRFYRLRRDRDEAAMQRGAADVAGALPADLQRSGA